VADDCHYAINPVLAVSIDDILLMSTPFGKRGHFFRIFEEAGSD
jgi:hypothetical protein